MSALVAFYVALVAAAVVLVWTGWMVGFVGLPIASMLGWFLGPNLQPTRRRPIRAMFLMSAGCTALGAYGTATVMGSDPVIAVPLAMIGIVIYGLPCFLLLSLPAAAWVVAATKVLERTDRALVMTAATGDERP